MGFELTYDTCNEVRRRGGVTAVDGEEAEVGPLVEEVAIHVDAVGLREVAGD